MRFYERLLFGRQDGGHRHRTREADRRQNSDNDSAIAALQSDIQTIVNVVYVTASPTFDGPIGGYTTLGPAIETQNTQQQTTASPESHQQPSSTFQQQQSSQQQSSSSSFFQTSSATSAQQQQSSSSSSQTLVAAFSSTVLSSPTALSTFVPSSSSTRTDGFAPAQNTVASISSATATPEKSTESSGMSGGAKAGLAFGIILGIAAIAGLVFFCYRRKKQQKYKEMDDEKSFARPPSPRDSIRGGIAPSTRAPSLAPSMKPSSLRSIRTASTAPRLSLRPVTQFLPDIIGKGKNDLQDPPPVPGLAMVPPSPTRNLTPPPPGGSPWARGGSPWERRSNHSPSSSLSNPFSDPINPFSDFARSQSPLPSATKGTPIPAPLNVRAPTPQDAAPVANAPSAAPTNTVPTTAGLAAGAMAGAAVAEVAAAASKRNDAPKPLNLEQNKSRAVSPPGGINDPMPSPTSDASGGSGPISTGTATAVAAGAPGAPGPSNVHRVQLDFKPSMDDELELRAGQLVRLLHEYDDGWALCIRLDRSQQGVAPRTCLSARPVKPRPAGGPRGPPGARGPPPRPNLNGPPNGRMSPAMGRPMSPAGGRNSPMGRPMSPANGRNSPAMNGRNSPAMMQNGPGGPRPMSPEEARARAMSPGPFNRAPRPLSPGPFQAPPQQRRPPQGRSMSPGPYGGGPQYLSPAVKQGRRRSNSAGAVQNMRNPPPGPSPLNLSSGPAPGQGPMSRSPPNRKPVPGIAM